jgi:hypothetical protein
VEPQADQRQNNLIKRCFKWAVAEELVSPTILLGLQAVQGLRYGRSEARETEPVRPVADEHVNATLPYLGTVVAAMVRLQRITGMRVCEVTIMRPCDIDQSGEIWVYIPSIHKNLWRGQVAIDFDDDFRFTHATLSANPTLFEDLFGITPEEFCSLAPGDETWPEEICWESVYKRGELLQWIATIPTAEEIAAHPERPYSDCQPLYPWLHIDECPPTIEPYLLCQRLLKESGDGVAVFADIAPYCGALAKYGSFLRNPTVDQIADCGDDHCSEVCRQYREGLVNARIAIGFATDENETWFPHVWLVQPDGKVLEVMDPFTTYFGIVLTEEGSEAFAEHYAKRSRVGRRHPRWD